VALFLAENSPYHILPVSELGCYAEEIGGGLRPPSPKLMDERLIGGDVVEAHTTSVLVTSGSSFLF
jgi:hypothetical protein